MNLITTTGSDQMSKINADAWQIGYNRVSTYVLSPNGNEVRMSQNQQKYADGRQSYNHFVFGSCPIPSKNLIKIRLERFEFPGIQMDRDKSQPKLWLAFVGRGSNMNQSNLVKGKIVNQCCHLVNRKSFFRQSEAVACFGY